MQVKWSKDLEISEWMKLVREFKGLTKGSP